MSHRRLRCLQLAPQLGIKSCLIDHYRQQENGQCRKGDSKAAHSRGVRGGGGVEEGIREQNCPQDYKYDGEPKGDLSVLICEDSHWEKVVRGLDNLMVLDSDKRKTKVYTM